MINFTANYIDRTQVKKLYDVQNSNMDVAFVEFNSANKNDLRTLESLSYSWGPSELPHFIYICADEQAKGASSLAFDRFFAITRLQDSYEKINPQNVLGIAQTSHACGAVEIQFLQTHPEYEYANPNRQIKKVGNALVKSIQKFFKNFDIDVVPKNSAETFYEKLGFVKNTPRKFRLFA